MITTTEAAARLTSAMATIQALAEAASAEQARWKPSPADWSILEVLCHLYDEEREDFRPRLRQSIEQPDLPLPPIDPEEWAATRGYQSRDPGAMLAAWQNERRASVTWLWSLDVTAWDRPVNHPHLTGVRVGDLLAAWVAHDLLHIRQLNELHYRHLAARAAPYRLDYAGDW